MLFLWGEHDGFGGLDVASWLVERMPNARVVVIRGPATRHGWMTSTVASPRPRVPAGPSPRI